MLNIQELLESGLIEIYCLGHATQAESQMIEEYAAKYPEIQSEVESISLGLTKYAVSTSPSLPSNFKEQIWNHIQKHNIDIDSPPLLNENHDEMQWKEAIKHIELPDVEDNVYMHPLRADEKVEIFLVKLREFIPDEHHEDIYESFLLLEGECECFIEGKCIKMKAGDYIDIPLWDIHNIKVISEKPVIAILQWLKAA